MKRTTFIMAIIAAVITTACNPIPKNKDITKPLSDRELKKCVEHDSTFAKSYEDILDIIKDINEDNDAIGHMLCSDISYRDYHNWNENPNNNEKLKSEWNNLYGQRKQDGVAKLESLRHKDGMPDNLLNYVDIELSAPIEYYYETWEVDNRKSAVTMTNKTQSTITIKNLNFNMELIRKDVNAPSADYEVLIGADIAKSITLKPGEKKEFAFTTFGLYHTYTNINIKEIKRECNIYFTHCRCILNDMKIEEPDREYEQYDLYRYFYQQMFRSEFDTTEMIKKYADKSYMDLYDYSDSIANKKYPNVKKLFDHFDKKDSD